LASVNQSREKIGGSAIACASRLFFLLKRGEDWSKKGMGKKIRKTDTPKRRRCFDDLAFLGHCDVP